MALRLNQEHQAYSYIRQEELEIRASVGQEKHLPYLKSIRLLFKEDTRAFIVAAGLLVLQQFSGISELMYYGP
jgi:hypothetical protein